MQIGFIDADQLASACANWSLHKTSSLADILCEHGWLLAEDVAPLRHLVERKLTQCGGDTRQMLANAPAEVRSVLATLGDAANQMTIVLTGDESADKANLVGKPVGKGGRRYQLGKLHAAGGIGEIWLAQDADLERQVAVKRLRSPTVASDVTKMRFMREARITGQLEHPGVVPIYEICFDDTTGEPYYAMRFLKGRTLAKAVADYHQHRKGAGPDSQVLLTLLNAFCIVCNTVAYAHSKGIVHRDLKCENVILGDYGEVVVIDWGLAKQFDEEELTEDANHDQPAAETINPLATLAGHVLGSPAYMAPEQAAGRLDLIGPTTDVYGLCAILYEILTGQPPFTGTTALEVLRKVQVEPPTPPSEIAPCIPAILEKICLQGLQKLPELRYAAAEDVAKAVQSWISDLAERRQAEEERERFFALSLDLLAIIDEQGILRQVSPAWQQLLDYESTQLLQQPITELIHHEDRSMMKERLSTAAEQSCVDNFESRALHCDGTYRWFSWNVTPIAHEQSVYLVGRDITELKRSQQLFEGVLQSAPDGMVLIDQSGRIMTVNRQTVKLFGYTADELTGQAVELLVPERFRHKHPNNVANFFANSSVRPMGAGTPLRGRHKDGHEFPADIALSPIQLESTKLVVASVRAIAEKCE